MPPKQKRWVSLGGLGGLALVISFALNESTMPQQPKKRQQETPIQQTSLVTDYNAKQSTLEALSGEMKFLRTENIKLKEELANADKKNLKELDRLKQQQQNEVEKLKQQMERLEAKLSIVDDTATQLNRDVEHNRQYTEEEIKKLKEEGVKFTIDSNGKEVPVQRLDFGENFGKENAFAAVDMMSANSPEEFFAAAPEPTRENVERRPVIDKSTGKAKVNANGEEVMTEAVITITSHTEPQEEVKPKVKKEDFLYIPSGAIISGVFLNGIDAPTGKSSQKNPFPTLIRIQKDAILPNYYTADIRECFLLMSGYGDLSSERAFLRGETISCIRSDGKIIDGRLDSYAVGDDGKAGVRGRLVSKQGQIIARSLLAGFAGGFAEMFDTTATPTLNTSSDGTIRYEDVYSSKAVKGGAAKGVSQALTRISDFYMDLAEAVYPVIEVDAGRQVDVVVSKGAKLTFKNVNSISTAKAESK